jgi:hypothetical protein
LYRYSHTWGTCQGPHNLHGTIHNYSCMHGFFNLYSQRIDYLLCLINRLCYLVSIRGAN